MRRTEPIRTHLVTLRNGLRMAAVSLPHLHMGHVGLMARGGPRFEDARSHGLSHFCEHMLFRGAGRFTSAALLALALEEVGGQLDAATYRDYLLYATPYAPGGLGRALGVLAALARQPAFRQIEVERRIVLEELNELEDGRGQDIDADNLARAQLFPGHPLGQRIDGTRANILGFGRRDLRAHHRRHYVAGNMALVIAGPEAVTTMQRLARHHLTGLHAGPRLPLGPLPEATAPRARLQFIAQEGSQTELRMVCRVPGEHDAVAPVLSITRRLLDDGMSSRLQAELVEAQGLAYALWADLDLGPDVGVFDFGALVAHRKVATTVAAILRSLARLARRGPAPEELRRAKRRASWAFDAAIDAPVTLAEWVGRGLLFDLTTDVATARQQLRAVSASQVRSALRRWLDPQRLCLTAVGQVGRREQQRLRQVLAEAAASWPRD